MEKLVNWVTNDVIILEISENKINMESINIKIYKLDIYIWYV